MTLTWTRDEKRVMWGYGEGTKCKFCDARPREMHTIKVGGKKYPYTDKGKAAAKRAAKRKVKPRKK